MQRVRILGVASYLPPDVWTTEQVEAEVARRSPGFAFPRGMVAQMTGIRTRRYARDGVFASDLAAAAARRVLEATDTDDTEVDLLLFASASLDLIEPATANIVQEKLGTRAAVFDIKNACNSFPNGLQTAEALIKTGAYSKVLVVAGETPSRGIKWSVADREDFKRSFLGYTFGDAGAAALLAPSEDERGIFYAAFQTISRHWPIAVVPGGGSMHPRGEEYTYFQGDGGSLRNAFLEIGPGILCNALAATHTRLADYRKVLVHQVSLPAVTGFPDVAGVPREMVEVPVPALGNIAAASLPVAFARAAERGEIRPGDRVI